MKRIGAFNNPNNGSNDINSLMCSLVRTRRRAKFKLLCTKDICRRLYVIWLYYSWDESSTYVAANYIEDGVPDYEPQDDI